MHGDSATRYQMVRVVAFVSDHNRNKVSRCGSGAAPKVVLFVWVRASMKDQLLSVLHVGMGKTPLVRIYRRAVLFAASLVKR